jgi:hypothetical protein
VDPALSSQFTGGGGHFALMQSRVPSPMMGCSGGPIKEVIKLGWVGMAELGRAHLGRK